MEILIGLVILIIVVLLVAINKNLIELRKESKKWLTEIAENIILKENDNSPS